MKQFITVYYSIGIPALLCFIPMNNRLLSAQTRAFMSLKIHLNSHLTIYFKRQKFLLIYL